MTRPIENEYFIPSLSKEPSDETEKIRWELAKSTYLQRLSETKDDSERAILALRFSEDWKLIGSEGEVRWPTDFGDGLDQP